MKNLTSNDFEKIAIEETPLIDVRAPIEFEKGAFLNAVNLPLMNDKERHLVGVCYKERGNIEATALGHQLVTGEVKEARIRKWVHYINKYPNSMIYCFRGGQRSQLAQQWIKQATGMDVKRLEGGYKAFRRYLLSKLEPHQQTSKPILLGGCTGSGKTILLQQLKNAIDLEGIANHRGSSFGKQLTPQPSPINFENNLAYALIQHRNKGYKYMILEDEGKHVGARFLPQALAAYFQTGDLVLLTVPLEQRIQITMDEYVIESQANHIAAYGKVKGLIKWADYIRNSFIKIEKRLGLEGLKEMMTAFELAYADQFNTASHEGHRKWIEMLLKDYYDPMYNYQIKHKTNKVIFEGNTQEVLEFLKNQYHI